MPAATYTLLNPEEARTLLEMRVAHTVPQRPRDRAHMVRLNAQGWSVPEIAQIFECHEQTVRSTIRRWEQQGLGGLWEAPGRGAKPRWQAADLQHLEQALVAEPRTYNSVQLAQKLAQERQVNLSPRRLRHLLQKRGGDGSERATATAPNKTWSKSN